MNKEKWLVRGSVAVISLALILAVVILSRSPGFWLILAKPTGISSFYLSAGKAAWAKDKKDEALSHYLSAWNRGNQSAQLYLGLGKAYEGIQNMNLASQYYEKATQADPESPEALSNWARVYVQSHRDPDTLARAVEAMKKAVEKRPKDLKMRYDLAFLYMQAGDVASARSQAQEILAKDPQHQEANQLVTRLAQMAAPPPAAPGANPFGQAAPGAVDPHAGHNH